MMAEIRIAHTASNRVAAAPGELALKKAVQPKKRLRASGLQL
jgi:hypothetical protein